MSEMLKSIKSDLTSRRMLPLVVLALGLLAGALAYAVLGGKASAGPVASNAPVSVPKVPGPSVSSAPANPNDAVAETTSGARYQHGGHVRNPFSGLPGEKSESSVTSEASAPEGEEMSPSGSSGATSESSPVEATGGSPPSEPSESVPVPQSTIYEASLTLKRSVAQPGVSAGAPQTFVELASLRSLPSEHNALLAYAGAQSAGNGALFLLVMPAIVHGKARCLPSAAACESIYVKAKQSEELQYLEPSGEVVSYVLSVKQIVPKQVAAIAATEAVASLVVKERTQLEELGIALPAKVHFSEDAPGLLTGIGEALSAAQKSEAGEKQAAAGETGTSGSGE